MKCSISGQFAGQWHESQHAYEISGDDRPRKESRVIAVIFVSSERRKLGRWQIRAFSCERRRNDADGGDLMAAAGAAKRNFGEDEVEEDGREKVWLAI